MPSASLDVVPENEHASRPHDPDARATGGSFTGGSPAKLRAIENSAPPVTRVAPLTPGTTIAEDRLVSVPSPSCPEVLWPQARTVPSARAARPWSRPEPIATASVTPSTVTGRVRWVVVPSPSSLR